MTLRQIYKNNISDTAMEVSISSEWRKKIFQLKKGEILTISYRRPGELPIYEETKLSVID